MAEEYDISVVDEAIEESESGDELLEEGEEEITEEERKRRGFQAKADKAEAENAKLRQTLSVLEGKVETLTTALGVGAGQQVRKENETVVNSPHDLMPEGAEFDANDAYTTGTLSYEARLRYEKMQREQLAQDVAKQVVGQMSQQQQVQQYQTEKQKIEAKYKVDAVVWNEFEKFYGNENALSLEEVFRIFLRKTGRALNAETAKADEAVTEVSSVGRVISAPGSATSRKPETKIDKDMSVFPDDPFTT